MVRNVWIHVKTWQLKTSFETRLCRGWIVRKTENNGIGHYSCLPPLAEFVYLQCPVNSMDNWKSAHGHISETVKPEQLDCKIQWKNDLLNGFYTPKFSLDLEKCPKVKRRTGHIQLYVDGIHPGTELSKLCLLRIKTLDNDRFSDCEWLKNVDICITWKIEVIFLYIVMNDGIIDTYI